MSHTTHPFWMDYELPRFAPLAADLTVDVVVVGAGLTGITTAYLLSQEGVRVALLDRGRVAAADTGRTTAHLTYVTDDRISEVADKFGADGAKAYWQAGSVAIDAIAETVQRTGVDCDFRWVPGYLHEPVFGGKGGGVNALHRDVEAARNAGFTAKYAASIPLMAQPGIQFARQARFHPRKYVQPLLHAIEHGKARGRVLEQTTFERVREGTQDAPVVVVANGHEIRCEYLVVAGHEPLMGERDTFSSARFHTRLSLYTSYVLGARLPAGTAPEALYWDTKDAYSYLRVDDRGDEQYAIFGGHDEQSGHERDAASVYRELTGELHQLLPAAEVLHRWSGQVVVTDDGMPFIGEYTPRQFIATGYCGNGFTLGTLAAMMARDRYLKRRNAWFDLFRADRKPFHGGRWRQAQEEEPVPVTN